MGAKRVFRQLAGVVAITAAASGVAVNSASASVQPESNSGSAGTVMRPLKFWATVGYFYRIEDCDDAGYYGRQVGTWSAYQCNYHSELAKPWELYAYYN